MTATDASGTTTVFTYDKAGRKIAEEKGGERITFSYDALGRQSVTQQEELRTITEYDLLGRSLEERQEDTQGNLLSTMSYTVLICGGSDQPNTRGNGARGKRAFSLRLAASPH